MKSRPKPILFQLAFVVFCLLPMLLQAQPPTVTGYTEDLVLDASIFESEPDKTAKEAVSMIVQYSGLQPTFTIISAQVPTAIAFIRDNKRYIAYNPDFIMEIEEQTRNKWGAVSVLAHEIGHHFCGHTLGRKNHTKEDELAADRFSGFTLYQMGATLDEARIALKTFGHTFDTLRHPPIDQRLEAISQGWKDAQFLDEKIAFSNPPPGKRDEPEPAKIEFIFKLSYTGDDNVYFVDTLNRVILFDNNKGARVVGRLEKAKKKSSYNFMIRQQGQIYGVDPKGKIWREDYYGPGFSNRTVVGVAEPLREFKEIDTTIEK